MRLSGRATAGASARRIRLYHGEFHPLRGIRLVSIVILIGGACSSYELGREARHRESISLVLERRNRIDSSAVIPTVARTDPEGSGIGVMEVRVTSPR